MPDYGEETVFSKSKDSSPEKNTCGESFNEQSQAIEKRNEEDMTKLVRGRPKGSKNYARIRIWQPVIWHAKYDDVIALHCEGMTNIAIAEKLDYSVVQVSNILNTEEGKRKIQELRAIKAAAVEDSMQQRHKALAKTAFERMESVISSDEIFENNPFAVFDRSLQYLKATAKEGDLVTPEAEKNPKNVNINVTNTFLVAVQKGLSRLENVAEIHGTVKK